MSGQPPVRSEGVNNPENATAVKKYLLHSRAQGDEEFLNDESPTPSPLPLQDSRNDHILEMEEKIRQLKIANARYQHQLAGKAHAHGSPHGESEDLMDEGHDYDPDYEGLEISANVETSLTKDKEPPSVPHETIQSTNEEAKRVVHPHNDAIVLNVGIDLGFKK